MKYIHIRNLEKYQPGYKDRKHVWSKMHIELVMGDENAEALSEISWSRLLRLIILETYRQKPTPLDYRFLNARGFSLELNPIEPTLNELSHFIEIIDVTEPLHNCNKIVTEMYPRVEKRREEKSIHTHSNGFKKPKIEDVKSHFGEKGFTAEAEKFFDYYEANGWRVGKNPMKNWHAAAANWLRNGKSYGNLETAVKREKRPDSKHEACSGTGKLPDGVRCWCWK